MSKSELRDVLREVLQHFVFDEEGDLTRAEFDDLHKRAERAAEGGEAT